jgi:hypothetical protein
MKSVRIAVVFSALVFAPSSFALHCAWSQFKDGGWSGGLVEDMEWGKSEKLHDGYRFKLVSERVGIDSTDERIVLKRKGKTIAPLKRSFLHDEEGRYEGVETSFGVLSLRCYW